MQDGIYSRGSTSEVFHDQTGYWMWDARAGVVMQSIVIPHAVCVLAGGRYTDASSPVKLAVAAKLDDPFADLAGKLARKLAVLAEGAPPTADANITWVPSPN